MARHPSPVVAKLNFASNSASCRRALSFALSCRRRPARRRRLSVGLSAIRCNIVCCCLPAPFDRRPRFLCLVLLRPGGGLMRCMAVLPRCFAELVRLVAAKTSGSARQAAPCKKASGRVPRLSAVCNRAHRCYYDYCYYDYYYYSGGVAVSPSKSRYSHPVSPESRYSHPVSP